ncbi:MAG: DUF6537 domain-containing protein, partial [Pseudomonadota bacterium]
PFGHKRRIDQSVCNLDYSCADGFCPSFVEIEGTAPKRYEGLAPPADLLERLPEPATAAPDGPAGILLTGVGGTGVVTLSAILGMAGHIDGKAVKALDLTGVAQKNGAVSCHLQMAPRGRALNAARLIPGRVDLLLACDAVVASAREMTTLLDPDRTIAVVNTDITPTAATTFAADPALAGPETVAATRLRDAVASGACHEIPSERLAVALCGDSLYSNILMLGYASQTVALPLSRSALVTAIRLNGAAIERNLQAFDWGRIMAVAPDRVYQAAGLARELDQIDDSTAESLDQLINRLADDLIGYQNAAYAARFRRLIEQVRAAEAEVGGDGTLTEAAARSYHKLLAYKDEYEVARLYSDPGFRAALAEQFGSPKRVRLYLAPPLLARRDPGTGQLRKRKYGPWMLSAMRMLSKLKGLRGTVFDPFGHTAERRMERSLIPDFEATVARLVPALRPEMLETATDILAIPQQIRGYGHVKEAAVTRAREAEVALWRRLENADQQAEQAG